MIVLLMMWMGAGLAAPNRDAVTTVRRCTMRGPLLATVDAEGAVEGTLGGVHQISGPVDSPVFDPPLTAPVDSLDALGGTPMAQANPEQEMLRFADAFPEWRVRRGGLRAPGAAARVDEHGIIQVQRGEDFEAWAFDAQQDAYFGGGTTGPVIPRDVIGRPVFWLATQNAESLGLPVDCNPNGASDFDLEGWQGPLEVGTGRRLVYAVLNHALLRGAGGPVWLFTLPLPSEHRAAELANELSRLWPDTPTALYRQERTALAVVGDWEAPAPVVAAGEAGTPALVFLRPEPALTQSTPSDPGAELPLIHDPGVEMVHRLNQMRGAAGLKPVALDAELMWGALGHCLYLWAGEPGTAHTQDPASPLFIGERPWDRGGSSEVVTNLKGLQRPWEAVDSWVSTPFHRIDPMHPAAEAAGACHLPDGTAVMEVRVDGKAEFKATLYPVNGQLDVPVRWSGHETPDPVPSAQYPQKTLPLGYTLTAWLPTPAQAVRVQDTWIKEASGRAVDHYVASAETHPILAGSPTATVHLMAKTPLAYGTDYSWGVRYQVEGVETTVSGRFRTVPTTLAPVLDSPYFDAINAARAVRGLEGLRPDGMAQALASLNDPAEPSAAERTFSALGVFDRRGGGWVSWPAERGPTPPPEHRAWNWYAKPEMRFLGIAPCGDRECVMLTSDPLEPRKPGQ